MVPGEEISARKALEISNYTSKQLEDGEKKGQHKFGFGDGKEKAIKLQSLKVNAINGGGHVGLTSRPAFYQKKNSWWNLLLAFLFSFVVS
nr:hypothetical protein Iba_chr05cCG6940 [Ipomoea batatas]